MTDALNSLEPKTRSTEQHGVWTVTNREPITDRVVTFIEGSTEEIVYMTVANLLTEAIIDALQAATERGVTIWLAGMSPAATEKIRQGVPDAKLFDSLWDWADVPAGCLLMADQEKTLASVLVADEGEDGPEPCDETAI
ncbi:hypothetical protein [Halostagnicola sp. A-GB9-2]|uniref:hypothetical protein n=1 Tax=Halostagnicola sp. A-GB9-2 TaxID=3048066 RepID=UPI0024BF5A4C|nr:hypothetical protein [Halostagnicola sp. A-GB9-2]MDJ1432581.1 hypothetical protein [Halostagnicola sp. A-GB9-2]